MANIIQILVITKYQLFNEIIDENGKKVFFSGSIFFKVSIFQTFSFAIGHPVHNMCNINTCRNIYPGKITEITANVVKM